MSASPQDEWATVERDDTDRKRAEESPQDTLAYVRSIVDTVREPLLVLDGRLRVQSANRSFYRIFQVSRHETEGCLLYALGNGQWDIPRLRTLLEEILPENTSFDDFQVEHEFPDIGRKVMLLNARKLRHEGAELVLLAIEDVTERRRLEAERQALETRFTSLVKNVRDHSIFTLDPEGRVTSWNVAAELVLGYTEAEALGRHFAFIFTPDDRQQGLPEAELRAARESGRAEDERWHLRKSGERFWALGIVSALHDAEGRLTGFAKILRDMTDWKHAQQALREREAQLAAETDALSRLNEASSRLWRTEGLEAGLQAMLDATIDLLGADMGNVQLLHGGCLHIAAQTGFGQDFLDFFREVSVQDDSACGRALRTGERTAIEDVEIDPLFAPLRAVARAAGYRAVVSTPILGRTRTALGMISAHFSAPHRPTEPELRRLDLYVRQAADFIERSRIETALRESEERSRQLVQSANSAIIRWRRDGTIRFFNEYAQRFFGWSADEVIGRHLSILIPETDSTGADLTRLTQDIVRDPERYKGIVNENVCRDGRRVWVMWTNSAICDASGDVIEILAVGTDMTAQKRAEAALQEANRRKDAFLATLAHELRNPLAPLRTGLDLLQALRGDAAGSERAIQMMERQLKHLVRLVDDLLDVSRISRGKILLRKERLDLGEIIDAALEESESRVGRSRRRLTVSVPPEALAVEGDRVRLVQIVANLLDNAVKFTDEGGEIALRVMSQGEQVAIQVEDNGRGISRDRLTGIFDIFSQVEPGRGGGLGIGLSLVRDLVAMHGGTVRADSDGLGRGATFTVSLPLCSSHLARPIPDQAEETGLVPRCRVLVVDDNHDITEAMCALLATLKAEVQVAHDGAAALEVCDDWSPTHVLMDLGLPGMDGYEAARRLCANHPARGFRLIALSGWGSEEHRQQARDAGFDEHLVKPASVAEIKALLSN